MRKLEMTKLIPTLTKTLKYLLVAMAIVAIPLLSNDRAPEAAEADDHKKYIEVMDKNCWCTWRAYCDVCNVVEVCSDCIGVPAGPQGCLYCDF